MERGGSSQGLDLWGPAGGSPIGVGPHHQDWLPEAPNTMPSPQKTPVARDLCFPPTFARLARRSICNSIETWKGIDADISQVHDGPLFHR